MQTQTVFAKEPENLWLFVLQKYTKGAMIMKYISGGVMEVRMYEMVEY